MTQDETYIIKVFKHPSNPNPKHDLYSVNYCTVQVNQQLARAISIGEAASLIRKHRKLIKLSPDERAELIRKMTE